jgi:16S rRNA processing protein RimM
LRGDVRVSLGGEVERGLEGYTRFFLGRPGPPGTEEPKPIVVESCRVHGRFVVVKFAGFETPEDARALLHGVLYVDREEMPELGADEYYHADLIGCRVLDEEGAELGRVVDVFATGAHDVLVVESDGREWMVPLVSEHVAEVDTGAAEVRVRHVGGLRG